MMSSQKNKISQCTFCLFQILILLNRLKIADARAEYGEMNITKLNQRIDNIEDDIIRAKVYSCQLFKVQSSHWELQLMRFAT